MMHAWQVPVSNQGWDVPVAHYMPVTGSTNELLDAACGKLVNPGFAQAYEGAMAVPTVRLCAKCRDGILAGYVGKQAMRK